MDRDGKGYWAGNSSAKRKIDVRIMKNPVFSWNHP